MSQTTSASGADSSLPELVERKRDRTKEVATPKREDNKKKKRSRNPFKAVFRFVAEIVAEMKKVRYPTGKELWAYFLVVIVFVILMMAFTGLVDLGAGTLSAWIFG